MADNQFSNAEFLGLAGRADARFRGLPTAGAGQRVNYSAAASPNAADLPVDASVMLTATTACFVRFSPTGSDAAVADVDMYLVANVPYLLRLGKNAAKVDNRRISVIRATADGSLFIMPMLAE